MTWLDNARILAIFGVILLHTSLRVESPSLGSVDWWIIDLYGSLTRWCVPVFIMISGVLLLDKNKKENLSIFYKKRLSRILWPLLFWSVLFLAWDFMKGFARGEPPSAVALAKNFLAGKPYPHIWFLYMMLGMYLFTPFFRKIIRSSTNRDLEFFVLVMFIIAATHVLYTAFYPTNGAGIFITLFLDYIPYFMMGHLIRQSIKQPSKWVLWVIFGLSFLATAFGCFYTGIKSNLITGMYFYENLSISVIPMSISAMLLLKNWEKPIFSNILTQKTAALTLGIYLVHPLVLELFRHKTIGISVMLFNPVISVPVISILVFATSLLCVWIMSQLPYIKRVI